MSNELSRRKFLGVAATAAAGGTAGCNTAGSSNTTETTETEDLEQTATETLEPTQTEEPEQMTEDTETSISDKEIEQALDATAFNLYDDMVMRGFDSLIDQRVDVSTPDEHDENYRMDVDVSLDSLFHTSGMTVRGQDLHTARELGLVGQIMEDVKDQIYELSGMVEDNMGDFYSEVGATDDTAVDVNFAIRGENNSAYKFGLDSSKEEIRSATEEFVENPEEKSHHSFHPMKYESLMLLEEGESITIQTGSEEHTIEYLEDGVFRINGNLQKREEFEKLGRFSGEDVYVEDIDPVYLQERGEAAGAVELEFEESTPEY